MAPPEGAAPVNCGSEMSLPLPTRQAPWSELDGVSLADSRKLAFVAVGEHLAAAVVAQPTLAGLLGLSLGVVSGHDAAVLLLDVPALAVRDDVDVGHVGGLPRFK